MIQNTHLLISENLVGKVVELGKGSAIAELLAAPEMAADERGLIHGGFTFGLADFAVMCAVNDPNVVLGGAEVKFLKPVTVGQNMVASANVVSRDGGKVTAEVSVVVSGVNVFKATMTAFVLERHILDK